MSAVPQVRGSAYLPFVHFMDEIGASLGGSPGEALLPAMVRQDPEALIPIHLAHAFLDSSARSAGLTDLGFVVGQHMRVDSLGAFGRSLLRSLTLHDALGKIRAKFSFYSSAERVWWSRRGPDVFLFHAYASQTGPGSRIARQCVLLLLRDLVRLAAGPAWQPGQILSPDATLDAEAMRKTFPGAAVRHSDFVGIVFPARFLSLPWHWPRILSLRDEREDTAFETNVPAGDFAGSVKQVISTLMKQGQCHLGQTAKAVGIHPRTLQRRLSETDEEYSDLLAEVRFEQALRLISDPAVKIIDVAGELGYSDSANFTRAFRQWTGLSPSDFRRLREKGVVAK
ncbi:MAG TPA: helix-turn-helix domain-containing protein [Rhizobiaceae bacterium]|nr:helix-turn-helix domain-containing protein [Rhizobiaceae bacterium]